MERDRMEARGRERKRACCSTRVCQCLPVSTPTYLCKSFNLTPPYRAYPERDRISKPIRIHCLDGGERRAARSTHSSHTIAFLSCPDATHRPCLYRRKVLRHACALRARVVPLEEIPAEIDAPPIQPRHYTSTCGFTT